MVRRGHGARRLGPGVARCPWIARRTRGLRVSVHVERRGRPVAQRRMRREQGHERGIARRFHAVGTTGPWRDRAHGHRRRHGQALGWYTGSCATATTDLGDWHTASSYSRADSLLGIRIHSKYGTKNPNLSFGMELGLNSYN